MLPAMRLNISFMGPERIAHIRRDLMLLLQAAAEECGHQVQLTMGQVEITCPNLLISSYYMTPQQMKQLQDSGCHYININSEVIKDDMLNFTPDKVDFLSAYLPFLKAGDGIMEMVIDNMPEHERYGTNAKFLRWAYHEALEDIDHFEEKDLDFYFFGFITERRMQFIEKLGNAGLKGAYHHSCPYYVRNSAIRRAKIIPNIIQKDIYTHVNAFRLGYLVNNRCAVISEKEHDPAGYQEFCKVTETDVFVDAMVTMAKGNRYRQFGEEKYDAYRKIHMRDIMAESLEHFFSDASPDTQKKKKRA